MTNTFSDLFTYNQDNGSVHLKPKDTGRVARLEQPKLVGEITILQDKLFPYTGRIFAYGGAISIGKFPNEIECKEQFIKSYNRYFNN